VTAAAKSSLYFADARNLSQSVVCHCNKQLDRLVEKGLNILKQRRGRKLVELCLEYELTFVLQIKIPGHVQGVNLAPVHLEYKHSKMRHDLDLVFCCDIIYWKA